MVPRRAATLGKYSVSSNPVSKTLTSTKTEAKLNAYEEDLSVALFVAPALLSESALSQTFNPASMRRHVIR
jgi:hypothetical protein